MYLILVVMAIILGIMLISIWWEQKRPFFRLVYDGDKYIIQYRKWLWLWRTYILTVSGKAAVYYSRPEAEEQIKVLVERRKANQSLDRISSAKLQVINYSDEGKLLGRDK